MISSTHDLLFTTIVTSDIALAVLKVEKHRELGAVIIKSIVNKGKLKPKITMRQTTLPISWISDAEEVSSSESSYSDEDVA